MTYFAHIEPIRHAGPDSTEPLAFRWYDRDRIVAARIAGAVEAVEHARREEDLRRLQCEGSGCSCPRSATQRRWQLEAMIGTTTLYDLIAIGSGPGGQRAAIQAAKAASAAS